MADISLAIRFSHLDDSWEYFSSKNDESTTIIRKFKSFCPKNDSFEFYSFSKNTELAIFFDFFFQRSEIIQFLFDHSTQKCDKLCRIQLEIVFQIGLYVKMITLKIKMPTKSFDVGGFSF